MNMLDECKKRTTTLLEKMDKLGIKNALFTDEGSIAYLAGFWGYLGIEFGRPAMLFLSVEKEPIVITPLMESKMVTAMTWVEDIRPWEDSGKNNWSQVLEKAIGVAPEELWIEKEFIPARIRNFIDQRFPDIALSDISPILAKMRMVKSNFEIGIMKQAGIIAGAMMEAAHHSLSEGVYEYESALAIINAGSRKASDFLTTEGWERFISPMIQGLQIMQSGHDTTMVHRRSNTKPYEKYDPVYFCMCNMAQFKQYKLGFDRMFYITEAKDEDVKLQEIAIAAQQAAIQSIKPGVIAEDVAATANAVYRKHGFQADYRTGRSIGMAYLEAPELKSGDKTVLQAGMTFAVDGGIANQTSAGRIGDSIVVTETGFDYLTQYSREILLSIR